MITLHTSYDNISTSAQGCVIAIGNFDGVHLGHRALIKRAAEIAKSENAPLGVMTFEPHPKQFFQPQGEPFRLTMLPTKQRLLADLGVEHLFAFEFNAAFSQISGDEFVQRILVEGLKAKHVIVGEDFAFGHKRSGTIDTLKNSKAFKTTIMPTVKTTDGDIYSSTAIRALLQAGKFDDAEKLLGHPWIMEAPVVHGDKRGRTLGFPTANQNMPDYIRIPYGVYAVKLQIEGENKWRDGAANFGIRPMFQTPQPIFETFIFDFASEIYGKVMQVQPVRHLRPELAFDGLPALMAQMKEDCITAKAVLKS